MRITVIVSSYRRPVELRRCGDALCRQTRLPDEVIVVTRRGDEATVRMLRGYDAAPFTLRRLEIAGSGLVVALNAALDIAAGDILAFTDDDAAPRPDWLDRLEAHFRADPRVGGVGGRDWIVERGHRLDGSARDVNRVQWFGRVIGNNHFGVGPPREVDVLKGANMSYRRTAVGRLRFDTRLRGTGAEVHLDHSFALAVRRAGWKLIYDPAIAVDHYPGPRFDEDQRGGFYAPALRNAVHNETLGLLEHLPPHRRIIFLLYAIGVGTWAAPGLAQWVRMRWKGRDAVTERLLAALAGRKDAWETFRRSRRPA